MRVAWRHTLHPVNSRLEHQVGLCSGTFSPYEDALCCGAPGAQMRDFSRRPASLRRVELVHEAELFDEEGCLVLACARAYQDKGVPTVIFMDEIT